MHRAIVAAAATVLLRTAAIGGESVREFQLSIDGPAQAAYSGSCRVVATGGEESVVAVGGAPPFSQALIGRHLDCRIRQDSAAGSLVVEVRVGANVSRSRTQGAGSVINISLQ